MSAMAVIKYKFTKVTTHTLAAAAAGMFLFYLAKDEHLRPTWFVFGVLLIFLGEGLRLWAAGHLQKNIHLTTSGPYAYVKNPLYIGTLLIVIGSSAVANNVWIMIAGLFWFFIYYAPYKKRQERQKLTGIFGDAWYEYDRAVPDYLPRITPYPRRGMNRWSWSVLKKNSEHETATAVIAGFCLLLYILQ